MKIKFSRLCTSYTVCHLESKKTFLFVKPRCCENNKELKEDFGGLITCNN